MSAAALQENQIVQDRQPETVTPLLRRTTTGVIKSQHNESE